VTAQEPQPAKTGQVGRYQIIMHPGEMPRFNTFLLDTVTGRTWMMKRLPDDSDFWEPVDKVDNYAEELALARQHQKAPPLDEKK